MENLQTKHNLPLSLKQQYWTLSQCNDSDLQELAEKYHLPELVIRILLMRGFEENQFEQFLNPKLKYSMPNPSILLDMDKAVERVVEQVSKKKKIGVLGDYDVDGATSSALLARFFDSIDTECDVYIPDRMKDGYGPNPKAFDDFATKDIDLVITVDCGTLAFDALAYAKEKNIDVIIIDHHLSETKLPDVLALINPNRFDESEEVEPLKTLAAVGVSFLFLVALHRALKQQDYYQKNKIKEPDLRLFLDLVALGTVCDVVSLQGLNRAYVVQGLSILNRKHNLGMNALITVSRLQETISSHHLGFILGPRVNAGGRVGESSLGSTLLRTSNQSVAQSISDRLELYNRDRQEIEKSILEEAMAIAEEQSKTDSVLIIAQTGWHPGVIGIVSSRIKDKYNRPTIIIGIGEDGLGKGSGRSVKGFDLGQAIIDFKNQGYLVAGGGHAMAAGLTIHEEYIDMLRQHLNTEFSNCFAGQYDFTPTINIEAAVALSAITPDLLVELEKLQPFGMGNAEPKFMIPSVKIHYAQIVGEKHIRLTLSDIRGNLLSAIAFGVVDTELGDALLEKPSPLLDCIGTIKFNYWNGRATPQLTLTDARYAG